MGFSLFKGIFSDRVDKFLKGVRQQDEDAVSEFINHKKIDVNARRKGSESALYIAVSIPDNFSIIKELIDAGADIDYKSLTNNTTVLDQAIESNNIEAVGYLLEYGVNPFTVDDYGMTPLARAINRSEPHGSELIESLIEGVKSINSLPKTLQINDVFLNNDIPRFNCSPLYMAIMQNNEPAALSLINHGADVSKSSLGNSLILVAAYVVSNPNILDALIRNGAEYKSSDIDFLVYSIQIGAVEVLKAYLSSGDFEEGVDLQSLTLESLNYGNFKAVKLLLDQGVDLQSMAKDSYNDIVFSAIRGGNLEILEYLSGENFCFDIKSLNNGYTLNIASSDGGVDVVKFLVHKGCDVNYDAGLYGTPLIQAIKSMNYDVMHFLLSSGAQINESFIEEVYNIIGYHTLNNNNYLNNPDFVDWYKVHRLYNNNPIARSVANELATKEPKFQDFLKQVKLVRGESSINDSMNFDNIIGSKKDVLHALSQKAHDFHKEIEGDSFLNSLGLESNYSDM
ncbi:MAG: hypothetical protein DGJ47_000265 [Rickettsiaceae bacterium]